MIKNEIVVLARLLEKAGKPVNITKNGETFSVTHIPDYVEMVHVPSRQFVEAEGIEDLAVFMRDITLNLSSQSDMDVFEEISLLTLAAVNEQTDMNWTLIGVFLGSLSESFPNEVEQYLKLLKVR